MKAASILLEARARTAYLAPKQYPATAIVCDVLLVLLAGNDVMGGEFSDLALVLVAKSLERLFDNRVHRLWCVRNFLRS